MRNATEVLDRALCLMLLADRGLLEKDTHEGHRYPLKDREDKRRFFLNVIAARELEDVLTPHERAVMSTPVEQLEAVDYEHSQWAYEAIPALLWAVSLQERITFAASACTEDYHPLLGKHRKSSEQPLVVKMRKAEDITRMKEVSLLYHWRAREGVNKASFDSGAILPKITRTFGDDFATLVKGSDALQLGERDILVDGVPYSCLSSEQGGIALHVTKWRHHALEWLCSESTWDEVSTDTI